ncbi:Lsr2 family protein [Curtobacterium sp. BRD11]|uniref:histone-like nucleoid-structuring protein Lsr2 n=1 Tax=Curtobacterium sp. BRD11 TaxID=2962581 RepID=UPI002881C697|nr:Lsr2 family protein [Curtobacterium sp. BRD11]MDT0212063.1 Lsr2 family protein [Curtobacterium sp. BRD11]
MAQKVTTTFVDDLDGREIEAGKGGTVSFAFDGVDYEIDLSDKNTEKLRAVLENYIAAARRVGRPGAQRAAKRSQRSSEDLAAIREWAAGQGMAVSTRGRIAQDVKDAFYKSQR